MCLAEFDAPLDISERQIVKFAEDELESDDLEIIVLNKKESSIDIAEILYEFITVSVPYIKICEQNGNGAKCDKEMIERLENLANPSQQEENTTGADPRWEALKKLK
ncbi:YceD family protein [Pedobacter sp. NJ-S-72]